MEILKKLLTALGIVLVVAFASPVAQAQEAKDEFGQHVEDCIADSLKDEDETRLFGEDNSDKDPNDPDFQNSFTGKWTKAGCQLGQAIRHPVAAVSSGLSEFWGDPVGDFTKAVLEGNNQALQTVMTFWMDWRMDKNIMEGSVQGVKNIVLGIAGMALISSLIIGGMHMAYDRRQGVADGLESMGKNIGGYLLFSTLIVGLGTGAMVASDQLADWVMKQFGASDSESVLGASELNEEMGGPILMLALAGVGVAGSIMQIVSLAVRTLLFPIALGITPALAAFSYTNTGRQGLNHVVSMMIACILFKPISALLYCVTFWQSASGGEDMMSAVMTVLMLAAAGFSGPALVRTIAPFVSQAGGGGAGSMLSGAAGLAGAAGGAIGMAGGALIGGAGGAVAGAKAGSSAKNAAPGGGSGGSGSSPLGGGSGGSPLGGGSGGSGGSGGAGGSGSSGGAGAASRGDAGTTASGSVQGGGARQGGGGSHAVSPGGSGSGAASTSGSEGASVRPASSGAAASASGAGPSGATSQGTGRRTTMSGTGTARGSRARNIARGAAQGAGRGVNRGVRTGRVLAGQGARAGRSAGSAARQIQGILDESIGQQGNYHGNVRR